MGEKTPENNHAHETPEDMIFAENLKEFANRVGLLVGLERGEKISSEEAYKRVKKLWKKLKSSHKTLLRDYDETRDDNGDTAHGGYDGIED